VCLYCANEFVFSKRLKAAFGLQIGSRRDRQNPRNCFRRKDQQWWKCRVGDLVRAVDFAQWNGYISGTASNGHTLYICNGELTRNFRQSSGQTSDFMTTSRYGIFHRSTPTRLIVVETAPATFYCDRDTVICVAKLIIILKNRLGQLDTVKNNISRTKQSTTDQQPFMTVQSAPRHVKRNSVEQCRVLKMGGGDVSHTRIVNHSQTYHSGQKNYAVVLNSMSAATIIVTAKCSVRWSRKHYKHFIFTNSAFYILISSNPNFIFFLGQFSIQF